MLSFFDFVCLLGRFVLVVEVVITVVSFISAPSTIKEYDKNRGIKRGTGKGKKQQND